MGVFCLNAIAGAGKTHAALLQAHALVLQGEWVLYVVPTVDLANEAAAMFRQLVPLIEPEVIHNETAPIVGAAIMKALKERPEKGRILFITWSAFENLRFFPARERWTVFIDEIPQAARADELIVPDSHYHFTANVHLFQKGSAWSRVLVKKRGPLRKLAETSDTAFKDSLSPLARIILSPKWISYTRTAGFNALVKGRGKKLTLHSVLRPRVFSGFRRVTILGANFTNSLLYMLWSLQGVVFEEDEGLRQGLRLTEHGNGHLVTFCYGLEQPWSKSLRDRQERAIWKRLVKAAGDRMSESPFGWIANKDIQTNPFSSMPAQRLPQVSHGLNSFQHLDNSVFLSARLSSPDHFGFLEWMGISGDDVRRATYFEPVYQTVMRGSIRDPNNLNPKVVVVPDRSAAEFLHGLFPGSTIEKLEMNLDGITVSNPRGRPRKHPDGTGRVQHFRAKRKAEVNRISALMTADPFTITNKDLAVFYDAVVQETCNENPIKEGSSHSVTLNSPGAIQSALGSVFESRYATRPMAVVNGISIEEFIKALRQSSRTTVIQKEESHLICPSIFDPDLSTETDKGLENVIYANGIWLDFDYGHLTHRDLASIFPLLRMVAFNSFSSTKAQPKFRVFIPTSRTMSAEEYRILTGQMVQVIKDAGYRRAKKDPEKPHLKAHGIDTSKLHAASLFFLPCRPRDPKGKIWKDHKGPERQVLDVDDWLENAIPVEVDGHEVEWIHAGSDDATQDQTRIDRAMARWNSHGIQKGMGDSELFILSQELKGANVPHHERRAMLLDAARSANSPADRQRQARRLTNGG